MPTETTDASSRPHEAESPGHRIRGIRGLLTAYYTYMLIAAGLCFAEAWGALPDVRRGLGFFVAITIFRFCLYVFATNSLQRVGSPWVRSLHIALNGANSLASIAFVFGITSSLQSLVLIPWSVALSHVPFFMLGIVGLTVLLIELLLPIACTAYWVWSERVKNTYAVTAGESSLAMDRIEANTSSKRAWLIATQLGAIIAVLIWLIGLPFEIFGPQVTAISFILFPAILFVSSSVSWMCYQSDNRRIASCISGLPIVIIIIAASGFQGDIHLNDRQSEPPQNGVYEQWHENGNRLSESTYVGGKRDGVSITWWENGQKQSEVTYDNGNPESSKRWDEDGNEI